MAVNLCGYVFSNLTVIIRIACLFSAFKVNVYTILVKKVYNNSSSRENTHGNKVTAYWGFGLVALVSRVVVVLRCFGC